MPHISFYYKKKGITYTYDSVVIIVAWALVATEVRDSMDIGEFVEKYPYVWNHKCTDAEKILDNPEFR